MPSLERRIAQLEKRPREGKEHNFIEVLRQARRRAAMGEDPLPAAPITGEMADDPVDGETWRKISEARERARVTASESFYYDFE